MSIIIMDSIHYILKAEKILKKYGINNIDLVPVPKEIDSSCGNAIEVEDSNINKIINILSKHNMNFKIFKFDKNLNFYLEIGGNNG